ncbi:MAG: DoxX family protein [Planctomycetes bacterium]|nr:DoxX family protein [Planctomycetota bacterium]
MSFSNTAGTSIIPTLSRIVLCAAFLPAGYYMLFGEEVEFSGIRADRLIELGVIDAPAQARISTKPSIILTSWQEAEEDPVATQPPDTEEPSATEEDVDIDEAAEASSDTETPSTTGTFKARPVHNLTLRLDDAGLPAPNWLAILAAWTELVGGALILVGFLSRLWGLALTIAMGAAFYLITWPNLTSGGFFSVLFGGDTDLLHTMFRQLGLFVLAFGVFMTGAGPLSLDRALFKKSSQDDEIENEEE